MCGKMFKKRRRSLLFLRFLTVFLLLSGAAHAQSRQSTLLIEAESGRVLMSENATEKRYPASLTKMMTLYMAFDALEKKEITIDKKLPVSVKASRMPKSRMGLKAGTTISLEDAIFAMISRSANDAAVVVAEALGGSEAQFADKMTRVARELGMKDTRFKNASGLHNKDQVTTARDMAILSAALIEHFPEYYKFFSIRGFRYGRRYFGNHNLVARFYKGGDGLKTGYVDAAGYHVVGSAKRDGKRVIGVVMGRNSVRERDRHIFRLLDHGFSMLKKESTETTLAALSAQPEFKAVAKPATEEDFRKRKAEERRIIDKTDAVASLSDSLKMQTAGKVTKNAVIEWR